MREPFPVDRHGLILFHDVDSVGRRAELYAAVEAGELRRIRRGVYLPNHPESTASVWERDAIEYRARVLAASKVLDRAVFTGFSAIALAGLPIFGRWPDDVYVLSRDRFGNRRPGVVAVARPKPVDVDAVDGCAVTSLEYSLIQVCRRATLAAALTAVDAAVRRPRFGRAAPMTTIDRVRAVHLDLLPYPGSKRTEAVLDRASDGADTPLETVSRLAFEQLGFEAPEVQHAMWLPELGQQAFLDFYWRSVDAGGEADGRGKYRGELGRSAADAVVREKDRENAIRRQVRAFDRWDWGETLRLEPLAARLDAMGVPRNRRAKLLIPPRSSPAVRPLRTRGARRTARE